MEIRYVDDAAGLTAVRSALESTGAIALDCEAAGYHRYSDRLCLIQLTVGSRTFLIDPLAIDPAPVLGPALDRPDREVIMHGADFDVRLLDRDLGLGISGLFDTQIAASLLGAPSVGLSALARHRLGVRLSKKYQKADWARRPLSAPMREYAAHDTLHLHDLAEILRPELEATGRMAWAQEEFAALEKVRFETGEDADPVLRVKTARDLEARAVDRLREALAWREEIAEERDRAPFRVAGDPTLVEAARQSPRSLADLVEIPGMNEELAREEGDALLERFRGVDGLPDEEVRGYPRSIGNRNGTGGRPIPEVEERMARLKAVRNTRAGTLGVDRGLLLPNAVLLSLATSPPGGLEEMAGADGIRRWQVDVLGQELLQAL